MSGLLNPNLTGSASNLPDSTARPFTTSFSAQSGSLQGFHHSALHNIHANYSLPNMPGSLAQRNAAMGGLPSSGVQQPGGRFNSNNLPVAMSQIPHAHSGAGARGMNVGGGQAFSSGMNMGGSIQGLSSNLGTSGNRNSVPGNPALGNLGQRSSQLMNMIGSSYPTSGGSLSQNQMQPGNNSLGSMGMLHDSSDSAPFDINDFPQLTGRPNSAGGSQGQYGSLRKQGVGVNSIVQQNQEFSIQNEDFPALPGFKGGSSDYPMELHHKEQLHENVPVMQAQQYPQLLQQYQQPQTQSPFRLQQMSSSAAQTYADHGLKPILGGRTPPDPYGLLGLLGVIRMNDPDLSSLALGIDLTTLGLNLNSPDNLYKTFGSPFSNEPAKGDPEYTTPACYVAEQPPALQPMHFQKFQTLILFYIFYSMPKDEAQICAANELYNSGWFYHNEARLWFTRITNMEPLVKTPSYERGSYAFFDQGNWETVRKDNFVLHYELVEKRPSLPSSQIVRVKPPPSSSSAIHRSGALLHLCQVACAIKSARTSTTDTVARNATVRFVLGDGRGSPFASRRSSSPRTPLLRAPRRGGFGTVYRGALPNGLAVAVRCSTPALTPGRPGSSSWRRWAPSAGRTINLVRLYGFCFDADATRARLRVHGELARRLLLRPQGRRREHAHGDAIATGVLRLRYLHGECQRKITTASSGNVTPDRPHACSRLYPGTVGIDLILLALPAVLGQAIDPMAQLMETAYIGKLGALEPASGGIGVAIFNILSKIFNIPLLSIATSFVAEDISKNATKHSTSAAAIGTIEALALFLGSGLFLKLMGVSPVCLGNLSAVVLLPLLIYGFKLGITRAAISTVASQYIIAILLMWSLSKELFCFLQGWTSGMLLGRTLTLLTMTIGTSMAARQGPTAMAAHQICLQVWLVVSLLADALHKLLCSIDYKRVQKAAMFALQIGLVSGLALAVGLYISFGSIARLFTNDPQVLTVVSSCALFVCASQPVNALAFIFDGLHYGVSDFDYVAQATVWKPLLDSVGYVLPLCWY
ncbi:hypothetical protein ZWY2020_023972 [Hordeum vulgare]|nr:hypothetical protein ZWY2020_023972 [Hordeum vulgare]